MTNRSNSRLRAAPFFVMRAPLLSFEELRRWSEGLPPGGDGELAGDLEPSRERLEAERARLRDGLVSLVQRPEVREALFLASPGFESLVEKWVTDPVMEGRERIEQTLCKYFARMASRPTPFGFFATISVGSTSKDTALVVAPRSEIKRRSRLDLGYLDQLIETAARDSRWSRAIPLRVNPTLYRVGGAVRYVEAPMDREGKRRHRLVGLKSSRALERVLDQAAGGASCAEIEDALSDIGVDREAASRFVEQLVACQALIPAVGAELTGPSSSKTMIEILSDSESTSPVALAVLSARDELGRLDEGGIGADLAAYHRVGRQIESLPVALVFQHLVQVDAARPGAGLSLGDAVLGEIARGVEALERMTPDRGENALSIFRDRFEERYQGREVPLLEALDSETGIAFPVVAGATGGRSPLIQGLDLGRSAAPRVSWGARERLLLRKLNEAASEASEEILLEDQDLAEVHREDPFARRRGCLAAMVRVAARSQDDLAKGRFQIYLSGIDGPGGARLLARFCGVDASLQREVEGLMRREAELEPKGEIAEIVHIPEGRAGNVLQRPLLRNLEIPVSGRSGAPPERQVPLSDLLLSVESGELTLRSRRLGCRIIPRQTTAYDPMLDGVTANRFLCALGADGQVDGNRWEWGPLTDVPFLPRVRYGRTIFSLAMWNPDQRALAGLRELKGSELVHAVRDWRLTRPVPIPRWVALVEGDEHLAVDLENSLFVESFLHATKSHKEVVLAELFPGPDSLVARGKEGAFVSELVVPFETVPVATMEPLETAEHGEEREAGPSIVRSFPPGSEWLFAKIYCGPVEADNLLRKTLGPLVRQIVEDGRARRWHFLRYGDPEWHLRLRFQGDASVLRGEVLPRLNGALARNLEDGTVWKLQVDTYEREVERYGGPRAIEIAEEIFQRDSELALWVVERLEPGAKGEEERWKLALCGVDRLLVDFGLDLDERAGVIGAWKESLSQELGLNRGARRRLADRYRRHSDDLMVLVSPEIDPESPLRLGLEAIERRSRDIAQPIARLAKLASSGDLTLPLSELATSFIHLQVNRILRSMPRATELVIDDFLERLYRSKAALERRS